LKVTRKEIDSNSGGSSSRSSGNETHASMFPSTPSYRSSTSSTSRRLRRMLLSYDECGATEGETPELDEIYSPSNQCSSLASVSSVTLGSERPKKKKSSISKSPMMVFLKTVLLRCFKSRKRRRAQVLAKRKTHHKTRSFDSIPTNEHEMFLQLHSKAKRSPSAQRSPLTSNRLHQNMRKRNSEQMTTEIIPPTLLIIEQQSEEPPLLIS